MVEKSRKSVALEPALHSAAIRPDHRRPGPQFPPLQKKGEQLYFWGYYKD